MILSRRTRGKIHVCGLRRTKVFLLITTWWLRCTLSCVLVFGDELRVTTRTTHLCPSSCYCDDNGEYVSCVGDGLWRFPLDIPNTTVRLELRNYMVRDLRPDDFYNLVVMQELKLQQSRIETIGNETFESSTKLERLDLSQNSLTSICSSVLKDLGRLRFLDLSSNSIDFVEEAFIHLLNLEQLNIRDNLLQQLTTHTFLGLHKVQYLNLDANTISSIEVGTFQYLTNLAHLIISNNPLTTLSRLDFFGSRLQYIDISHVGLDRVPQSLTKFVRDLRLAKNNLTHISAGDFDSYPYLGLLVLDDNCVSEIENDALGRQEYLMRLWLNGNCLTRVPPNLPPSLLALYMEENKLTELPSYSFKGLVHLEQLFLQRNEIQNLLPCVFCDLVSLKSLDLQANQIENLTRGVFSNLTQLETLDISQNALKSIDSRSFEGLTRLTSLQMSRVPSTVELNEALFDPLQSLQILEVYDSSWLVKTILNSTRMLHGLRRVQELNIMHNRIMKLRSDFPSFFPSLKVIKMSGNSWHCNADIKWLSNWIKQSNVQFYSSYNIRCASPLNIQFKPIMMLTDIDFESSTTESQSVITSLSQKISSSTNQITTASTSFVSSPGPINLSNPYEAEVNASVNYSSSEMSLSTKSSAEPTLISAFPYRYQIINENENNESLPALPLNKSEFTSILNFSAEKSKVLNLTNESQYFTPEVRNTSEFPNSILSESKTPMTVTSDLGITYMKDSSEESQKNNQQTVSPQRRVLSSRLRVVSRPSEQSSWDHTTTIVVVTSLAAGSFVLLAAALTTLTILRFRHRYQPVKHRNMRRSSSISYYPQKDEVSIVTLTEGTVGLRTNSHHGLGNKLYYIMENGNSTELNRETLPDPQLQELLPQPTNETSRVY